MRSKPDRSAGAPGAVRRGFLHRHGVFSVAGAVESRKIGAGRSDRSIPRVGSTAFACRALSLLGPRCAAFGGRAAVGAPAT